MTPEEQRRGETLEERLAREVPDGATDESTGGEGQLVDDGPRDVEKDMVADMATGPRDVDDEDDLLDAMGSVDDDEPGMEEAAVHVVEDEAPGGSDDATDRYVAEEGTR